MAFVINANGLREIKSIIMNKKRKRRINGIVVINNQSLFFNQTKSAISATLIKDLPLMKKPSGRLKTNQRIKGFIGREKVKFLGKEISR